MSTPGQLVQLSKLLLRGIGLIERQIQRTLDFRTRTLGITQKFDKFCITAAIKALCNVMHDGTGSALDLVF